MKDAMRCKARDVGGYTFRDLERDGAGVSYSHAAKLAKGTRSPTPDTVRSISRALAPYLSLDEALLSAGFAPDSPLDRILRGQDDAEEFEEEAPTF